MQNQLPQDPSQADRSVVALMHGIKTNEGTNGDYNGSGDKGTAAGIGQWSNQVNGVPQPLQKGQIPMNFVGQAKRYGLDPSDFSPENQNKVMYASIAADKKSGLTPEQILSKWNSGDPNKYLNNATSTGTGPVGKYDVASYVKNGMTAAQKYAHSQPPNNPSSTASPQTPTPTANAEPSNGQPPQSFGQKALGAAEGVGNFFFPIVKDVANDFSGNNDKSFLQQAGDLGLSALPFVPGLGEYGEAARGAGLLGKGVALGKTLAAGAATGYGADVASHLSSGETDPSKIFAPGFGTLTGGALSGVGAGLAATGESTASRMINSLIKPLKKDFAYGKNPGRGVAAEGIVGNSLDDLATNIEKRRKEIGQAIEQLGDSVSPVGGAKTFLEPQISLSKTLSPIDTALEDAAKQNNEGVFSRLQKAKQALTDVMGMGLDENGKMAIVSKGARTLEGNTYNEAQKFKQLIGDMTQWTGNMSDDKAVNAALQDVWRSISSAQKDALEKVPGIGPELKAKLEQLNERYGDLTSAGIATKYREVIHGRQNILSLSDKILGGIGGVTGLATGGIPGSAVLGAVGTGISHLAGTTAVKSRVARALAGAAGKTSAVKASSRVKGLAPRLLKTAAMRGAAGQ